MKLWVKLVVIVTVAYLLGTLAADYILQSSFPMLPVISLMATGLVIAAYYSALARREMSQKQRSCVLRKSKESNKRDAVR